MCGLFGMTLPDRYPTNLVDRGDALCLLGELAESRGRDAAGISARLPGHTDRWWTERAVGPFSRLSRRTRLSGLLRDARTALGHTRAATQGALTKANASPAAAGPLLCTHNGDLDIDTIPFAPHLVDVDATDSAALFAALASAHRTRVSIRRLVTILSTMRGRAALAWTDTTRPGGRVWLARAGLSPLTFGVDVDGGLWWASNPRWLRQLTTEFNLPFTQTWTIPEGSLISATPLATTVKVTWHADFKPTVRFEDQLLVHSAVWRGLAPHDRAQDHAVMRHRVHGGRRLDLSTAPAWR